MRGFPTDSPPEGERENHAVGRPIDILLVEDNPGDVELTCRALEEAGVQNQVHVAADGAEALAFLRREGSHGSAPRPGLVLLDLNLPRVSGREVLAEMKAEPALQRIPVVVMSSSDAERDVCESYALHANCYIRKPADLDQFTRALRAIEEFWLGVVRLPER